MRSAFLMVLVVLAAGIGCDMIKSHMPAPTANKAVSVPVEARLVAMGSPDILSLPADRPGTYYFAEDDTSKIVSVVNIEHGQPVMTPELRNQLEPKRKYRVYLMGTTATTAPAPLTTTPPATGNPPATGTPPATGSPQGTGNPPASGNPLAPSPRPANAPTTTPVM